jgi:predicted DNA-binding protein (MmcQ/YjbR family)
MMNTHRSHDDITQPCLALPATCETLEGQLDWLFTQAGKMFCSLHSSPGISARLAFKACTERFLALTDLQDMIPARHPARYHREKQAHRGVLSADQFHTLIATRIRSWWHG